MAWACQPCRIVGSACLKEHGTVWPQFSLCPGIDGQNSLLNIIGKSVRLCLAGIELFTARPLINPNK